MRWIRRCRKGLLAGICLAMLLSAGCGRWMETYEYGYEAPETGWSTAAGVDVSQQDTSLEAEKQTMSEEGGNTQENLTVSGSEASGAAPSSVAVQVQDNSRKVLLTGDSRTVGLYCSQVYDEAEYPKHIFYNIDENTFTGYLPESIVVAKGGMEYYWMERVGMPYLLSHLQEAKAVVIWFGVNDLQHAQNYIDYMNSLLSQCSVPLYYANVGPARGNWEKINEEVLRFNDMLCEKLNPEITIIDVYSFVEQGLYQGKFALSDGLHYDYQTSKAIYEFIMSQIP